MAREYCPRCRSHQTVRVARQKRRAVVEGKLQEVVSAAYHCSRCNSVVRSEDEVEAPKEAPREAPKETPKKATKKA